MIKDEVWRAMEQMQGEIAHELRTLLGESAYDQRIFTPVERARRIEAMKQAASDEGDDASRHEKWCEMHVEQGWQYGPEFDPSKKTHPNLMPWDGLPASTRSKARIFTIVSNYARALSESLSGPST